MTFSSQIRPLPRVMSVSCFFARFRNGARAELIDFWTNKKKYLNPFFFSTPRKTNTALIMANKTNFLVISRSGRSKEMWTEVLRDYGVFFSWQFIRKRYRSTTDNFFATILRQIQLGHYLCNTNRLTFAFQYVWMGTIYPTAGTHWRCCVSARGGRIFMSNKKANRMFIIQNKQAHRMFMHHKQAHRMFIHNEQANTTKTKK